MNRVLLILKEFSVRQPNSIAIKALVALMAVFMLALGIYTGSYSEKVNKGLAQNLIRLHVVANSDLDADQALKRDIRDSIISYMKVRLANSKDLEHTKEIVTASLKEIERLAMEQIQMQGMNYPVKATLGSYPFPTKTYGDVSLPAGEYEALRVVIGKGEGANWWCVLFPPLCFVDATHGTIPDSVKENLKNALSEEEFKIITTADNDDDIPIKIKFKVVEVFQNSRIKFTGMISSLFKPRDNTP